MSLKVPTFKTEKIREDILGLVNEAPFRSMYSIVMDSIDYAMGDLSDLRADIPDTLENEKALADFDQHYADFGEREAFYYQAFSEASDRNVVDKPLFEGDYSEFDFEGPGWPDIETPWRLANELARAAARGGMDQDFLDQIRQRFKNDITEFWNEATRLIDEKKSEVEADAPGAQASQLAPTKGRRYGFWPYVAMGAVAVVGALGAASGYSKGKGDNPDKYVEDSFWGRHKKTAKTAGLGFAFGVAAATLIILRVNR